MSETENQESNQHDQAPEGLMGASELDMLKSRARMMNITFSNNIGVEALKAKIDARLNGEPDEIEKTDTLDNPEPNALDMGAANMSRSAIDEVVVPKKLTIREHVYQESMALIRCRITNLDPKKKDLPGEIITVANEYLGTVRKFVPFGEVTEDGYHLPKVLYDMLKTRKFLNITTTRDRRTGAQSVQTRWVPEFALEVLEPLTKEELQQLGQAQIAAGSVPDSNAA